MKNSEFPDFEAVMGAIAPDQPVLIAGCTASGKSALALEIAARQGGIIVNADAMQVYDNWSVLTARPPEQDLQSAEHVLYGHVARNVAYTVGEWLRDVDDVLARPERKIIVGGTGLFFRALTEGLADIPLIDDRITEQARTRPLPDLLADLDAATLDVIDTQNPARVQRAWAVQTQTGRSILDWHADTPPPLMPLASTFPIHLDADPDWLSDRIERRFDIMVATGALEEAQANLAGWNPDWLSSRAIGAPELIAHVAGDMDLSTARDLSIIATRQYAKRQRTWFRKRMSNWNKVLLG